MRGGGPLSRVTRKTVSRPARADADTQAGKVCAHSNPLAIMPRLET